MVHRTIAFLDGCVDIEGLYRISGSGAHLEYLREQFDQALEVGAVCAWRVCCVVFVFVFVVCVWRVWCVGWCGLVCVVW